MPAYNFHTHTHYSDGHGTPEEFIEKAISLNFNGLGFTEHSPLPFETPFALKAQESSRYISHIKELKKQYSDLIEISLGLEADYIPGVTGSFDLLREELELDYIIGSVHLVKGDKGNDNLWFIDGPRSEIYDQGINTVFDGDPVKAVKSYWEQINGMIQSEKFDVIGHLDKIKMHNKNRWFSEDDAWYEKAVDETIHHLAQKDILIEVNTRGRYKGRSETFFPDMTILRKLREYKLRLVINSDAHQPGELNLLFPEATAMVKQCGYKSVWVFNNKSWEEIALS